MTRLSLVVSTLVLAAACQSQTAPREPQTFADDAVSLIPPLGWQVKHQKDTLVFADPANDGRAAVIAIRTVPVVDGAERRTADSVLASVKTVLAALPAAEVRGPTEITHPAYRAISFDVVFTPRSKHGQRYRRRHVILQARDHLYHAFLTAPEGQLENNLPEFEKVLASIREEA